MQNDYLARVYAGFLGMNVGIRLGAPVEPTIWTYERIKETYGDIRGYVKDYKNFAADDDVNGPVYFFRALRDSSKNGELTPEYVAKAWLNYARDGIGMFWWGGYGVSTEHTAYINLTRGIPAPQSGSAATNGKLLSDQIGGQIFIDTWGLIWPGRPDKAADYAQAAASVSHDGEGLNGARYIAACIALAFQEQDIGKIVELALKEIPSESLYAKVVEAVIAHHKAHPDDWESCLEMLHRDWGYDKYGGVCHIIPNAGVCVLAMLYGAGDFNRTVEIATMCSWDTDCNAGNVGTVLGVLTGLDGIAPHYRAPINDGVVLSGISGYLNILDLPTYAKELARTGYALAGEAVPQELEETEGELHFDFELPGSTHNFRTSDPFFLTLKHSTAQAAQGTGSLEILVDRMVRGNRARAYYKPFYTRADFSDERYKPVFSPQVYSGQTMEMQLYFDQWAGWDSIFVSPYFRTVSDQKIHTHGFIKIKPGQWQTISCTIEDTQGDMIDEIGIVVEGDTPTTVKTLGKLYLTSSGSSVRRITPLTWLSRKRSWPRLPLRREPRCLGDRKRSSGADVLRGEPGLHRQLLRQGHARPGRGRAGKRRFPRPASARTGRQAVLHGRIPGRKCLHLAAGLRSGRAGPRPLPRGIWPRIPVDIPGRGRYSVCGC